MDHALSPAYFVSGSRGDEERGSAVSEPIPKSVVE